jgi:hypothetical protein
LVLPVHQRIAHEKGPVWGLCCNAA